MTDRDLTPSESETLEHLIDAAGLQSVLMALSDICDLKSEHLAVQWQDTHTAKRWATAAGAIGTLVTTLDCLVGDDQ